jgi:LPS-assembly protein
MPSSTSLDQKFSDVVGETKYNINDKVDLSYNFSLDQSYKEFNYNEISSSINFNKTKFNIGYLQEKNHIGSQEFVETGMGVKMNNSSELNFTTKRNLLTNSAEFYNLSYNYINDCLKAGIAYRREFYTDRDIEPDNKLMFTISFVPFGQVNSAGLLK